MSRAIAMLVLASLFYSGCAGTAVRKAGAEARRPLLIQFGQSTPDTKFMREHVSYWEEYLPFDGIAIHVNADRFAGRYGHTGNDTKGTQHWPVSFAAFGPRRADIRDYAGAIADLKATRFRKFKHNFVPLGCSPAQSFQMNWFSDEQWAGVLHNVRVLARIAKEGGLKGILFDTETYGSITIWNYKNLNSIWPGPRGVS